MTDDIEILRSAIAKGPAHEAWGERAACFTQHTETADYLAACHPDRIARLIERVENAESTPQWKERVTNCPECMTCVEAMRLQKQIADYEKALDEILAAHNCGDECADDMQIIARNARAKYQPGKVRG